MLYNELCIARVLIGLEECVIRVYNIARAHPNLISIGVIMVYFSTYARPCVHPMTCAS